MLLPNLFGHLVSIADEPSMKVFCICIAPHCQNVLYVHIQYMYMLVNPMIKGRVAGCISHFTTRFLWKIREEDMSHPVQTLVPLNSERFSNFSIRYS